MKHRRIFWQIFPSYILITFLSVVAIAWYGSESQRALYQEQVVDGLQARLGLIENYIRDRLISGDTTGLDTWCKEQGRKAATRLTVVLPSGQVIADSHDNPAVMDNHSARPEIRLALDSGQGLVSRYSLTEKKQFMYLAKALRRDGDLLGIVRVSLPLTIVDRAMSAIGERMVYSGLVVALIASLLGLWISRRISFPLERLRLGAGKFAQGELNQKLEVSDVDEIGGLAEAMNQMAGQLNQRINTITEERREKDAILASMAEGVMAVDMGEKIIGINAAAARFFDIQPEKAYRRILQEVVRNVALQQLVSKIIRSKNSEEVEITLDTGNGRRVLQALGSILKDAQGEAIGAVVVFNDVTKIRELENLRRDFVANASHELRTPITSIKGFVETLLDGAMANPDDLQRFLKIIDRHAGRLNSIVEDLLNLSRIEQGVDITFENCRMKEILENAVQSCEISARAKKMTINIECPPDISGRVNPVLLELAFVNLIDNAIKYSDEGAPVIITGRKSGPEAEFAVIDKGKGIGEEHLDRIFERFYRVDKARSREQGGTGLGLAIVKHIVLAHKGRVEVKSNPGQGSTFFIRIPL